MERTNVRYVTKEDVGELIDFASIDVAFISLTKVLGPVKELLKPAGELVALIKPQFEAGRENVGKKGVVKDPKIHEKVIEEVISFAKEIGFVICGLTYSPVKGPEGNIEYLMWASNNSESEEGDIQIKDVVSEAHKTLDH
jgi:23S rRNA (cytidine1920-2'-O)/16S rRNA (cytidine1409-2'-O)-methyltransferase